MRFHGVCGRLGSHPLHENRLPGDTLFKNPHRSSKSAGLETPVKLRAKHENKREAEVIRELVSKGLDASHRANRETAGDALLRLALLFQTFDMNRNSHSL